MNYKMGSALYENVLIISVLTNIMNCILIRITKEDQGIQEGVVPFPVFVGA